MRSLYEAEIMDGSFEEIEASTQSPPLLLLGPPPPPRNRPDCAGVWSMKYVPYTYRYVCVVTEDTDRPDTLIITRYDEDGDVCGLHVNSIEGSSDWRPILTAREDNL